MKYKRGITSLYFFLSFTITLETLNSVINKLNNKLWKK